MNEFVLKTTVRGGGGTIEVYLLTGGSLKG